MSQTTAAPAAASPDRSERALAPLNTFDKEDISSGAAVFDKWLREVTDNYITLMGYSGGFQINAFDNFQVESVSAVPEPSTFALLTGGAVMLVVGARRRRHRA